MCDPVQTSNAGKSLEPSSAGGSVAPAMDADNHLAPPDQLQQLFEANARQRPDSVAVIYGNDHLSYAQIESQANQLAHYLRTIGAGPGECVGMLLPRGSDVYITLLAILKTGAAYVPLDPEYPADRINFILGDCNAAALVTTTSLARQLGSAAVNGQIIRLDQVRGTLSTRPNTPLLPTKIGATPDDLAYIIYTSGSTGRPKGVEITHRNACNLVRAEQQIFCVQPTDRVYQGFSIAFDASVEEVWLALASGAALVCGSAEMVHAGPDLPRLLTAAGVTVLSCVPTLLLMMRDDLPTVRLLILGGEACPQDIARRWCKPGRRVVNTYGPTEATVIASYADLAANRRVTIGRAVPNYRLHVLDESLQPLAAGVPGELHIGGAGVARGYVGRPDLTAEKFIPDPFGGLADRLYKSGDLVQWNTAGELEFLGRIDTQVKLRGFRIELSEIESALMQCPGVVAAVATVREDHSGIQQLVAYIVPVDEAHFNEEALRDRLRSRLPAYMVPALIDPIDAFPTLSSGKVDRKHLPPPAPREAQLKSNTLPPRTAREKKIAAVWNQLFAPATVGRADDFFLDLGGHSLLAAAMVSELREQADFADLSVIDVYRHPTIEKLAAEADSRRPTERESIVRPSVVHRPATPPRASRLVHMLCAIGQLPGLYALLGLLSLQWLAPYITYSWMLDSGSSIIASLIGAIAALLLLNPALLLLSVIVKWTVIGHYKEGRYPLWGSYYLRWWFVQQLQNLAPIESLHGTPLLSWYYRLMGAKIGRNVHFNADAISMFDLVSVGNDSTIGTESNLSGYTVENSELVIGKIEIGQNCFVGVRSVLGIGTRMGNGSSLEDLSLLPAGKRIPAGQRWIGSPAQRCATPSALPPRPAQHGTIENKTLATIAYVISICLLPMVYMAALFPGLLLLNHLDVHRGPLWFIPVAPLVGLIFVVGMAAQIVALKWLIVGRIKPGTYRVHSGFYVRKWIVDQLMGMSLTILGPLYATLYLNPWYKALGAKLGKNAEISTASSASPDLLEIDEESFIADFVSLGAPRVDGGWMTLATNRVGKRAFVGNSAAIPPGTVLGDNTLIGVLSAPPLISPLAPGTPGERVRVRGSADRQVDLAQMNRSDAKTPSPFPSPPEYQGRGKIDASIAGTSWLGSPSFFLPQRQTSGDFSDTATFNPTPKLYRQRYLIEFFRVTVPAAGVVILCNFALIAILHLRWRFGSGPALFMLPIVFGACGLIAAAVSIACKWLLMGRYKPCEKPLWSTFVWRTEFVTAVHEGLANSFLIDQLAGTPWICWFFRLMGSKIGRQVYLKSTYLTEFDLITIGDYANLNGDSTLQTHLFEDRVMKMSTIDIGVGCTIGTSAVVLYDTRMEPGSTLGELSLLMKGESLPAGTSWQGVPARRIASTVVPATALARSRVKSIRSEVLSGKPVAVPV